DLDAVLLLAGLDDCVHGSSWARPSSDGHVVDMVRRPSIRTRNAECTARLARASNGTAPIGVPMKGVPRSWPTACNRDGPTLEAGGNSRRAGLQRARSVALPRALRAGASGPMRPTHHGYLEGASAMCLNCGCMQAHNDMGKPGV